MNISHTGTKLRGYLNEMQNITHKVVSENKKQIADANRSQMMDEGIDNKGKQLGEYSDYSKELKKAKGQETEFITLYDTGEFHKSIELAPSQKNEFVFKSDPIKVGVFGRVDLLSHWPDALGLTEQNIKVRVIKPMKRKLIKGIKQYFK